MMQTTATVRIRRRGFLGRLRRCPRYAFLGYRLLRKGGAGASRRESLLATLLSVKLLLSPSRQAEGERRNEVMVRTQALSETCQCGHSVSFHYSTKIPSGNVSFTKGTWRVFCDVEGCPCETFERRA